MGGFLWSVTVKSDGGIFVLKGKEMAEYDEVRAALSYISPEDRDTWFKMGASIMDEFGQDGFELWDDWARQAEKYNARDARDVWRSIKPGFRSIGSLFITARASGYRPQKPYQPLSEAEKARRQAESEAKRLEAERLRQEGYERVKGTAQRIWAQSVPATLAHPYLTAKGITDPAVISGIRQNEYNDSLRLQIPVFYDGQLYNLQSIDPTGGKRFLKNGRKDGGYTVVGDASQIANGVVIAEGFATAASIHQATGQPVIVAFDADNMVKVSETLARNLPSDTKVTIAVDNDASGKGLHSARQTAALFGGRAVAIEPEFSMQQIQKFQQTAGLDKQGRPKLPSDYNDLHQLAGIDAVRKALAEGRNLAAPEAEPPGQTDAAVEQAIADERAAWQERRQAAERLTETETVADGRPSENPAQAVRQENDEMAQHDKTPQPAAAAQAETNSIEYVGRRQVRTAEPYQPVDPEHPYGIGRTSSYFGDVPPLETDENGRAKYFYESDFAKYQLDDARTDIRYVRTSPEAIQKDLDAAGDIDFYYGVTHSGRTVMFSKTEQGWQSPQPGIRPEPSQDSPEPVAAQRETDEPVMPPFAETKKPVTDLNYRIPPDSIAHRYVVSDGKYLSIENGTTVMFTDSGKKINTARSDAQTVNDMLEVVREKGWDSIRLTGSKAFKAAMYLAAESRGIRTSGYRPTKEELAYLDHLRQERALNGVEAQSERGRAVTAEPQDKVPPAAYPGDRRTMPSEKTEAAGRRGRRPVEVEVPVYDQEGNVTGTEKKQTHRNMFNMEIVRNEADKREGRETVAGAPDTVALSKADEMLARSKTPSEAVINTSHAADTQPGVPLQGIGAGEIPSEVAVRAAQMKSEALDVRLQVAKGVYLDKAGKLSKPNKQRLQFHERMVMDTIRGIKGEAHTLALTNYYEHTAEKMKGTRLNLPKPVQIPTPQQSLEQVRQQHDRTRQQERQQDKEPEMALGR